MGGGRKLQRKGKNLIFKRMKSHMRRSNNHRNDDMDAADNQSNPAVREMRFEPQAFYSRPLL